MISWSAANQSQMLVYWHVWNATCRNNLWM